MKSLHSPTFDLYSQDFKRNPYPTFAAMRQQCPVHRQPGMDGETQIWFVTGYEQVDAVLRDDKTFARDYQRAQDPETMYQQAPLEQLMFRSMLAVDGEEHRRLRTLVGKAFTPRRVQAMRPRIEAIANELIDAVYPSAEMNLLADFAYHLPTIVISEMLGIPQADRLRFRAWTNAVLAPNLDQASAEASYRLMLEFKGYLDELFASRRATPADDLISALLRAEADGDTLSTTDLYATVVLLIIAGHETTMNLICNSLLALWHHPDQLAQLTTEPGLMDSAVEELLRYDGSVERALNRWVVADTELDGQQLKRGDIVIVVLGAANHDETVFNSAESLDLTRQANKHLGFGRGIHYCMGAPLARLETSIALNTLLTRLPNLRLAVDKDSLRWRELPGFRALEALPVRWDLEA